MGEVFVKNGGEWNKIVSVVSAPGLQGSPGAPGSSGTRNRQSVIVPATQGINAVVQATIIPIRTGSRIFVRPFGTLSYGGVNTNTYIYMSFYKNNSPMNLGNKSNPWLVGTFGGSGQNPVQTTVLSIEGFDPTPTVAGIPLTYKYNFSYEGGEISFIFTGLGLTLEEI